MTATPMAGRSGASRSSIKTAAADRARPQGRAFAWGAVVGALGGEEARSVALAHYRAAGFAPDDVARSRAARVAAVEALIRAEDHLENEHAVRLRERAALRAARRRLEAEVWP